MTVSEGFSGFYFSTDDSRYKEEFGQKLSARRSGRKKKEKRGAYRRLLIDRYSFRRKKSLYHRFCRCSRD